MEFAEIDHKKENEIVVSGMNSLIEIWSLKNHKEQTSNDDEDFGSLAEDIGKDIDGFNKIIGLN